MLVSGGLTGGFERGGHDLRVVWLGSIASAEVYDPSTETWSLVDDMPEETGHHSLEMAENGAVVVVGGLGESAALYPESTEGGRRVSVLRRQEGAPVLLG